MDARRARLSAICAGVALGAAALVGCAPTDDGMVPAPTGSQPSSASPAPTPWERPSAPVDGEVASAAVDTSVSPTSASSVSGPGVLVSGRPFSIEGECVGSGGDFELTTADPSDAGRTIVAGTIDCAAPMRSEFGHTVDYAGPVQLAFTDTDDIDQAWMRVVQP